MWGLLCPFLWGSWLDPHLTHAGAEAYLHAETNLDSRNLFGHNTPTSLQTGQGRQDNGPIAQGEPFYKRSPKTQQESENFAPTVK